jgi:hypothetical protein
MNARMAILPYQSSVSRMWEVSVSRATHTLDLEMCFMIGKVLGPEISQLSIS